MGDRQAIIQCGSFQVSPGDTVKTRIKPYHHYVYSNILSLKLSLFFCIFECVWSDRGPRLQLGVIVIEQSCSPRSTMMQACLFHD